MVQVLLPLQIPRESVLGATDLFGAHEEFMGNLGGFRAPGRGLGGRAQAGRSPTDFWYTTWGTQASQRGRRSGGLHTGP